MINSSPVPLYHRIASTLSSRINTGVYRPGSRLGTETELAEAFGVSRITVRKALDTLGDLVERRRAHGTFVSSSVRPQPAMQLNGNLEDILLQLSLGDTRIAEWGIVRSSPEVAQALHLAPGTEVYRLSRHRMSFDEIPAPRAWLVNHFPIDVGEAIRDKDVTTHTVTALIDANPATRLGWGLQRVWADAASDQVATALRIPKGGPVLAMERTLYATDGRPLDIVLVNYRADQFQYTVRLDRISPTTHGALLQVPQLGSQLDRLD